MFSMMHSVKITRKNTLNNTDDFINPSQMTAYSQHLQYSQQIYYPPPQSSFSYYYPDYDSRRSSTISQTSDQSCSIFSQISDHSLTKKPVPNMEDFLENLDQEFGKNKFTCYLSAFKEQEILVNQLTRLSDSEYITMGVIIIGHRQILRDEAKKYE